MTTNYIDSSMANENKTNAVLLLIDVVSDFEFEDGEKLFEYALPMARRLAKFKRKAKDAGIPVVYVNDNFGKWQEDFKKTIEHCLENKVRGSQIVEMLKPETDDYYVLKLKHSAFYSTALDVLLEKLAAQKLILTGVATDICVLFTANDAYMREYEITVAKDCVAAVKPEDNQSALRYMERVLKAKICDSTEIDFREL